MFTSASPVTDLVPAQVKSLKLRVPGVWKHTTEAGTETYTSPAKDAQVLVDVGATATPMDGGTCLNKILTAMGQEGWSRISLGGQPAAKKVAHDQSEDKQTEVETVRMAARMAGEPTRWPVGVPAGRRRSARARRFRRRRAAARSGRARR